ncbi:MAG: UDP-N-acetylglucosamine 1-carboxyvinyltransferase, partial [Armatimonadota bacterium]
MSVIRIVGGRELAGTVEVGGSKNATLAILSGVVLSSGKVVLRRVPQVRDVQIKAHLLEDIGASVSWDEDTLTIDCGGIRAGDVDAELVRSIRTSFYLLGPLVARLGSARLPQPGGCK